MVFFVHSLLYLKTTQKILANFKREVIFNLNSEKIRTASFSKSGSFNQRFFRK